jgi:hypothetical protein
MTSVGLRAPEALGIDRLLEQWIERGGDEEVEVGYLGQPAERQRRGETSLAQDAAQSRIGLLAPAAATTENPADDIVERVGLRKLRCVDVELGARAFRRSTRTGAAVRRRSRP